MDYEAAIKQTLEPLLVSPEKLRVIVEHEKAGKFLIGLTAHANDIGRVIGRGAGMIKSLQLIFKAIGREKGHAIWISAETGAVDWSAQTEPAKHPKVQVLNGESKRQAVSKFEDVLLIFLSAYPDSSVEIRDVGNHTLFRIVTKRFQIPNDLIEAYQYYAKSFGKIHGVWLTIENDYS